MSQLREALASMEIMGWAFSHSLAHIRLAEACLLAGFGMRGPALEPEPPLRLDAAFFGESPSRFIVSAPSRAMPELQSLARRHHVEIALLGLAGGDVLELEGQLRVPLSDLRQAWEGGLA